MNHDQQCERGERIYLPRSNAGEPFLFHNNHCHCRRRARIAAGNVVAPDLTASHQCSACGRYPSRVDGEYHCRTCRVMWPSRWARGYWTDGFGYLGEPVVQPELIGDLL